METDRGEMRKNSNSPQGVLLFDMDGTLVDTSGDIVRTVNYVRSTLGKSVLCADEVLGYIGQGNFHLLSHVSGIPETAPEFGELLEKFKDFYLKHQTECSHPYPGIEQVLEQLGADYDLYVLSNKPHIAVVAELAGHGLDSFFREIWGAGALAAMKPDPIGIHTAAEMSAVPISRTVMIGDMLPDIQAAENAGAKSCFVSWGFGEFGEEFPEPSVIVDSVPELVAAVDSLVGRR